MRYLNSKQILLTALLSLFLSSCIQPPVFTSDEHALLVSSYPVFAINGIEIDRTYHLELEAGENTVEIVYHTYQHDYVCTFSWLAMKGEVYEVTDQENRYPLTLYHWYRKNSLWAIRKQPVDPITCI